MDKLKVDEIYAQQSYRQEVIANIIQKYKNIKPERISKGIISTLMKTIESAWEEYEEAHKDLLRRVPVAQRKEATYFAEDEYNLTYDNYVAHRGALLDQLEVFPDKKVQVIQAGAARHVPELKAPTFDGDPKNWIRFKNLFTSVIKANTSIPTVEKLHFLEKALAGGSAVAVIAGLDLTSGNFNVAWNALLSEYENLALLVGSHIREIINLPKAADGSLSELQRIQRVMRISVGALRALEREVDHWDDWLSEVVLMKIDAHSRELWENSRAQSTVPAPFDEVQVFLSGRIRALERSSGFGASTSTSGSTLNASSGKNSSKQSTFQQKQSSSSKSFSPKHTSNSHNAQRTTSYTCAMCKGQHRLMDGTEYLAKTPHQRLVYLKSVDRCFNCLNQHKSSECKSRYTCQTCRQRHHTTIHQIFDTSQSQRKFNTANPQSASNSNSASSHFANPITSTRIAVLLATARVRVHGLNGAEFIVRALVDQGSEASFINESLAQRLRLPRKNSQVLINGIGASSAGSARGIMTITCSPRTTSSVSFNVEAFILPKLTSYTPPCKVYDYHWPHLENIELADPEYSAADSIDMILGAEVYAEILQDGCIKGPSGSPIAQNTSLGWILSGAVRVPVDDVAETHSGVTHCHRSSLQDLSGVLKKFWLIEDINMKSSELTQDEVECQNHFRETHSRDETGRFVVRLPFKYPPESLGESRAAAVHSLDRMNRRFLREEEFKKSYCQFMDEYHQLNHMTKIPDDGSSGMEPPCYYLPHHGVIQTSANITKMRVVFNGSKSTSTGKSLNDILHIGPQLQRPIHEILLTWTGYRFVFSADVEKMFRQVLIHPDDRKWQRILWRLSLNLPLQVCELDTVTYGMGPSLYLSVRTLKQLGEDNAASHPRASQIIKEEFYVDDLLSGADTIEDTIQQINDVIEMLKSGGIKMKKWIANADEILQLISVEDRASTTSLTWNHGPCHKALGMKWLPDKDVFVFQSDESAANLLTKRQVMSKIASLFDPLGWLSPLSIRAKIIMRHLWHLKLGWDSILPEQEQIVWKTYVTDLNRISELRIPRWNGLSSAAERIEVHGFSDASKDSYAAAVYLRILNSKNVVTCRLVASQTRVTPLAKVSKPTSIARLELCGTVLLCQLVQMVLRSFQFNLLPIYLWTDSRVALHWIHSDPGRWQVFVAHRVAQIQKSLPQAIWQHIEGAYNPADCASRGVTVEQLKHHELWWHGPMFLRESSARWSAADSTSFSESDNISEELKSSHLTQHESHQVWDVFLSFSSLFKLLRYTAIWIRYLHNLKNAVRRRKGLEILSVNQGTRITTVELDAARLYWIKSIQNAEFHAEVKLLNERRPLPGRRLAKLSPFIDGEGVLRIGGRLKHSLLDWDEKHPVILPAESHFTRLLIEQCHQRTLHGGTQLVLSVLRRQYWILNARSAVKAIIHRCLRCLRFRAESMRQQMGDLPATRVQRSRPFAHTGVDFAGPISIRTSKGRGIKTYKGYISVFVCLSTRAVHLEAVSDYTTDAFLAAYYRFVSRRGICQTITSDQGTNFVGADAELRRLFTESSVEFDRIFVKMAENGTEWRFNPPAAPHFGGIWEAAVKSTKSHLRRVIGELTLTFEELTTSLCQIEACLNSRPLHAISDDPDDLSAITPGHFLTSDQLLAVPRPSVLDVPPARLSRWQITQQVTEHFWERWRHEHLHDLQTRHKWTQPEPQIQSGDLVLVRTENLPPTRWPLARVLETHPGADGLTRVVTLKTRNSTIKRPIVKLILLPRAPETSRTNNQLEGHMETGIY